MWRSLARIKGAGFILWHTRHELYHITLGVIFVWYLRGIWHEFSFAWLAWAILGSLIPDLDHFVYFFTYGKKDWYTLQIRKFLRDHQWRTLWQFVATGHKYNTELMTHNYFVMLFLFSLSTASLFINLKVGVILFGSMFFHYVLDVVDDLVILGHVNANWKRWGKPKRTRTQPTG